MTGSVAVSNFRDSIRELTIHDIDYYFTFKANVGSGKFGTVTREELTPKGAKLLLNNHLGLLRPGSEFALKMVVVHNVDDMKVLEEEIINLKQMHLRGSVRYYGCFITKVIEDDPQKAWIVTNFIDGENLQDLIKDKLLNRHQKNLIAYKLAYAILECHSNGIVHRDLKPSNIMVPIDIKSKKEDVILVDFGLSCNITKCSLSSTCSNTRGTHGYIDLHAKDNGINGLDMTLLRQSDWWAYGQILVYMYANIELFEHLLDEAGRKHGTYRTLTDKNLTEIPKRLHEMLKLLTNPSLHPNERPTPGEIIKSVTKSCFFVQILGKFARAWADPEIGFTS
jgi:serine/threonine protein kinase